MPAKKNISNQQQTFSLKKIIKFIGIMFVFIYAAFILIKQQVTLSRIEALKAEQEKNIAAATLENQILQDEYKKSSTDEYLEQAIRENLGYIKPNERVFVDISR